MFYPSVAFKKRPSPGDFPRHRNTEGPDSKNTVTKHDKYSIRGHPALISLQGNPFTREPIHRELTAIDSEHSNNLQVL